MKQEVARAHKGWALDQVKLQNIVTKNTREEIMAPPIVRFYGTKILSVRFNEIYIRREFMFMDYFLMELVGTEEMPD
jgi:hypothetical protein